jgi:hypothetical protein
MTRQIGVLCALPAILAMTSVGEPQDRDPQEVSVVQLIATPERFEGRRVRAVGFCHFAFEEQSLYLHREDADLLNARNAVWLAATGAYGGLNDTFVLVEGTFTAQSHGHLGAWPGELKDVTRLERAGTRRDYERPTREAPKPRR